MLDALHAVICELERDRSLEQPERLRERILALDRLDDLLLDAPPDPLDATSTATQLHQRAQALQSRLAHVQRKLCEAIRQAIIQGAGAQALRGWTYPDDRADPQGYDHLDALVSDVLSFDEPTGTIAALDAEMVFYQPTPARHVFDLIERAAIVDQDVLVDLGSGLGHVPLLVSICTGAHCIGIEREAAYVDGAKQSAQALQLDRVNFVAQDAREADFSRGTVFYLYTPFTGGILREVLDRLKHEASRRAIRIATLGPCTATVDGEPWLQRVGPLEANRVTLFQPLAG
ncbi:class I SAM-dependent methyltransferase [Dyella sp. 20L07]|uniref:class I SAM-dependent methyltransferase n=1 Tax=Dyella sp. 20L07 TaxID=3384240 RepID=UPI003D27056D